jgi:hypothetical protein
MDLLIDHINNKCYCDDNNYNCINLNNCNNRQIIINNCPLLTTKNYNIDSKCNDVMIDANEFKKLLGYVIKTCKNNDRIVFLLSYYYLLIKNIKLLDSLYFFYEQFIVYAYSSLKYNILVNYTHVNNFNKFFIKHFKTEDCNSSNCFKILNEWCDIFENIININK